MPAMSVYASEPAFPILAHSLLSQPLSDPENPGRQNESLPSEKEPIPSDNWNLKYDIDNGIRSSSIFRCGKVIGFSRLKRQGNDDDPHCVTQVS